MSEGYLYSQQQRSVVDAYIQLTLREDSDLSSYRIIRASDKHA